MSGWTLYGRCFIIKDLLRRKPEVLRFGKVKADIRRSSAALATMDILRNRLMSSESSSTWFHGTDHYVAASETYKTMRPLALHARMASSSTTAAELNDELSLVTSSALQKYVQSLLEEHNRIVESLNTSAAATGEADSLRLAYLAAIVECHRQIEEKRQELEEMKNLINDSSITDPAMVAMAKVDIEVCKQTTRELEDKLLRLLMPLEPLDRHDVVVEVTAGVGGLEAMLFAKTLFDMYQSYALFKGWDIEALQCDSSELGGLRHGNLRVSGYGAYSFLKFEGGVHRVQRVPQTEKSGRIHTSTVTVAVMPQPNEIEVDIKSKDLKVETKRASGAGGQHVNKTDSAVRLTHLPSGIVVESQSERSQVQNKSIAMHRLQMKLYLRQYEEALEKHQAARRIQVGTSGRSEKMRTYNFVQDRITDHRLGANFHRLTEYLSGGEDLDHVIGQLMRESQREMLIEIISRYN